MKTTLKSILLILIGTLAGIQSHAQTPLAGHLSFVQEGVHAHLYWEKGPIANDESILRIEFMNASTHQAGDIHSALDVVPRMQMGSMEHGTSPVTIEKIKDQNENELLGQYRVSKIFFVMSGPWKVKFNFTHSDQTIETQIWNVQVPATVSN